MAQVALEKRIPLDLRMILKPKLISDPSNQVQNQQDSLPSEIFEQSSGEEKDSGLCARQEFSPGPGP